MNSLSGVVAAEVPAGENKAYAFAGDELDASNIVNIVGEAGFPLSVSGEEYLSNLADVKSNLL